MKKMTAFQAQEVIKAWRADALWGAVAEVFELGSQRTYFPYVIRVRVMMGKANKLANNALWDHRWASASKALQQYGLEMHTASQMGMPGGMVNHQDGMRAADFRGK